jgi:hypothetical protein
MPDVIANERTLDDRLGEVLRRVHRGLALPLWADLEEHHKRYWRSEVKPFLTILASVGVKVEIDGEKL